ncbi:hypothetical protein AB4039_04145 [Streptomyces sp. M-16]
MRPTPAQTRAHSGKRRAALPFDTPGVIGTACRVDQAGRREALP